MATPEKPSLDYSYTAFQQGQGNNDFPGTQLDNDLANLKQSIDETIDFSGLAIRSDGALQNGIVTKASLGADVLTGVAAPHPWVTATDYEVDDTVTTDNALYLCLTKHTSGVFATDFSSGKWDQLAVWSPLSSVSDGSITETKHATGGVSTRAMADGAATTPKIADGAVTRAKAAANFGLMPIGATLGWDGPVAPPGWLFKFGQALSRSTYADLMSAITATVLGNAVSASNTLTGVSTDLRNLGLEGAAIEGPGLAAGTTVLSFTINTIVLSTNATSNATSGQYRIFPHGNGDASTTFNIPDDRDVAEIGRGNMGGSSRGLVTTTGNGTPGLDTSRLGVNGGVDRHALSTVQLPVFTPTGTVTVSYPAHQYFRYASGAVSGTNGSNFTIPSGDLASNTTPPSPQSFSPAMNSIGGGQAHPNLQPSVVRNKIIFTGVV